MNTLQKGIAFDFSLPKLLECAQPTEVRGIPRDGVRLMVSRRSNDQIHHAQFSGISQFLREGDVLIINTSGTMNAALPTQLPNGKKGRVHLSTKLSEGEWLVEVRQVEGNKTKRFNKLNIGTFFSLPQRAMLKIIAPFYQNENSPKHIQLWRARFSLTGHLDTYLEKNGDPIRYQNLDKNYPSSFYQTVFAHKKGSAEMPSAGRAFTPELITQLVTKGIQFAPIILHTGVSSLETGEKPYPEYYKVPPFSASLINRAREEDRRIIAVGTTAIRAIESSLDTHTGRVIPSEGMTELYITPGRGLKVVNAMLTGFHEPKASHLLMLEALASRMHLLKAYEAAIEGKYQWHEFGDLHLIL
jgi:S-adenosylmethionine:tRNA ribosyltransferase-isomerase